jgi:hypothetical protein
MSAEMMISAMQAVEADARLSTLEKLLLIRLAWKTRPGEEIDLRIKTAARELNASRDGTRKAMRRLEEFGYFTVVSVKVVPGPRLLSGGGSLSNPQRGRSATPIKNKAKEYGLLSPNNPLRKNLENSAIRRKLSDMVSALTEYQKSCVRAGKPVLLSDGYLSGSELEEVRAILRKIEGV